MHHVRDEENIDEYEETPGNTFRSVLNKLNYDLNMGWGMRVLTAPFPN